MKVSLQNKNQEIKRQHDTILVLGDGWSMPSDLQTVLSWQITCDVGALGRGIKNYPGPVQHWLNVDGESAIHWAENLPNGEGTIKHTIGEVRGFDVDWNMEQPNYHYDEITGEHQERIHGSSALFAVLVALEIGYQKIVLAGCPLDTEGHYYFRQSKETLGPIWLGLDFMAWLDLAATPKGRKIRSMSGYTAKILGQATKKWINEKDYH